MLGGTVGPKQKTVDLGSILNHQKHNFGPSHRFCRRFSPLGLSLARQKPVNSRTINVKASHGIARTEKRSGHAVSHRPEADETNFGDSHGYLISRRLFLHWGNTMRAFHDCIWCTRQEKADKPCIILFPISHGRP